MQGHKKILMHLGTEKTGTTSIQQFLSDNIELLERNNVSYLKPFRKGISHNFLTKLLRTGEGDFVLRKTSLAIRKSEEETFLFSSETAYGYVGTRLLLDTFNAKAMGLKGLDAHCMFYFRRQDLFLEAIAKQRAKNTLPIADAKAYAVSMSRKARYHTFVKTFNRSHPDVTWSMRDFNPASFAENNVIHDFLTWLNINCDTEIKRSKRANPTPSMPLLTAIQSVGVDNRFIRLNLLRALNRRQEPFLFVSNDLFTPQERSDLMQDFYDENVKLSEMMGQDLMSRYYDLNWDDASSTITDPRQFDKIVADCRLIVEDELRGVEKLLTQKT